MIGTLLSRLTGRTEPEEDEWASDRQLDPPTFLRDGEWQRGALPVRLAPLVWSMTPPRRTLGNFYVRRPGDREYIMVRVQPEDEYLPGMEWFGPLPEPRP